MTVATQEFWQRAWLQELGVEWRRPLPRLGDATADVAAPPRESTPVAPVESNPARPSPAPVSAPEPRLAPDASVSRPASAPPVVPVATEAAERAPFELPGRWRWSWWQAATDSAGVPALLLRPFAPAGHDDPRGRELLANAMAAIGRVPLPRSQGVVGGVLESGCNLQALQERVAQPPVALPAGAVAVVVCMPDDWPLPPQPSPLAGWEVGMSAPLTGGQATLQLALIPAPSVMLRLGAAAKRLAWRALAPLHPDSRE